MKLEHFKTEIAEDSRPVNCFTFYLNLPIILHKYADYNEKWENARVVQQLNKINPRHLRLKRCLGQGYTFYNTYSGTEVKPTHFFPKS